MARASKGLSRASIEFAEIASMHKRSRTVLLACLALVSVATGGRADIVIHDDGPITYTTSCNVCGTAIPFGTTITLDWRILVTPDPGFQVTSWSGMLLPATLDFIKTGIRPDSYSLSGVDIGDFILSYQFSSASSVFPTWGFTGTWTEEEVTSPNTRIVNTIDNTGDFSNACCFSLPVPGPVVGAGASSFDFAAFLLGWLVRRRSHQVA
jgi:hypothetical protein